MSKLYSIYLKEKLRKNYIYIKQTKLNYLVL